MDVNTLNDAEDEETKEDGYSTEEGISGPIKLVGGIQEKKQIQRDRYYNQHCSLMKKESSTNLQKYSGMAEQMIKMISDCPEITK